MDGRGSVIVWAYISASGTCYLFFSDDTIHDGSSIMNTEVYRYILSNNIWRNISSVIPQVARESPKTYCQAEPKTFTSLSGELTINK